MHRLFILGLLTLIGTPVTAEMPRALTDADFFAVSEAEARLGHLLFFDPILSGNRNISCATCHHPHFGTGDGLSLGLGEGGIDLGPERHADPQNLPEQLIPRNAPPLFNLGSPLVTALFADGRIEVDLARTGGLRTPLGAEMVAGFANLLSAQTMFPVLSPDEMAGHYQENDIATAVRRGVLTGPDGAWRIMARRVADIPEYQTRFEAVYPEIADGRSIAFTDISNAIAGFMTVEWRSDNSIFDAFLRGERELPEAASAGAGLFFGAAGCSQCHAGPMLSDFSFHAMGEPQLGPGKAERFEGHSRDVGRMRVTGRAEDAYAFRTPPLRNVLHTGPWGHAGAWTDLRAFLAFHSGTKDLGTYARNVTLPRFEAGDVWAVLDDPDDNAAIIAGAVQGPGLSAEHIDRIIAFLGALTDPQALSGTLGIPKAVPSGLPVER